MKRNHANLEQTKLGLLLTHKYLMLLNYVSKGIQLLTNIMAIDPSMNKL